MAPMLRETRPSPSIVRDTRRERPRHRLEEEEAAARLRRRHHSHLRRRRQRKQREALGEEALVPFSVDFLGEHPTYGT